MNQSRRQFLSRCSGALIGTAAAPAIGAFVPPRMPAALPDLAGFISQLHTVFGLKSDQLGSLALTLSKVERSTSAPNSRTASGENFFVHFEAGSSSPLPQGTYAFSHPVMGEFDLFIVPAHGEAGPSTYVATFHQAPSPA